jgi:3-hydroxyisobutyrate dehydrogenase-like beta-hydroxyacid dehydrogenase
MTMLADDHAVEECTLGDRGVLAALPRQGVHVSLSTTSPGLSRRLAEAHAERDQSYVAAPVFGRPEAAAAARLVVVVAGPAEAVERVKPLLEAIGQKLFVLGPEAPTANVCKLAGNFLVASSLEALGEAFALLRKAGLDPQTLVDIMNVFPAPVYQYYGQIIAERKFQPAGFAMHLGLKDVRLILGAADDFAAPMPLAGLKLEK